MLCHRLLRPIADTHTVGKGTEINPGSTGRAPTDPRADRAPNRRGCMSRADPRLGVQAADRQVTQSECGLSLVWRYELTGG
jgi:hypothetical protein